MDEHEDTSNVTTKCIIFVLLGHLLIVFIPSNCKMTITTYYLTLNDIDGYFINLSYSKQIP